MARQKRGYRWSLFIVAVASFFYTILGHASFWSVLIFFVCGTTWFWLERRKTRELDALPPDQRHLKEIENE